MWSEATEKNQYEFLTGDSRVDPIGFSRVNSFSTIFCKLLKIFRNLVFILIFGRYCIIYIVLYLIWFYLQYLSRIFMPVLWLPVWFKYFCHINSRFVLIFGSQLLDWLWFFIITAVRSHRASQGSCLVEVSPFHKLVSRTLIVYSILIIHLFLPVFCEHDP